MMNLLASATAPSAPGLPDDLSLYLGKKTLVKLILEAIQVWNREPLDYRGFASAGKTFQQPMLLTLLTYCYATGVYASTEIELNIERDPMTRYLCARTYPNIDVIRGFRRFNVLQIKQCLTAVLNRAWQLRFSGEDEEPTCDTSYAALSMSRWSGRSPAPDFNREADDRVAKAVRADSMALDV